MSAHRQSITPPSQFEDQLAGLLERSKRDRDQVSLMTGDNTFHGVVKEMSSSVVTLTYGQHPTHEITIRLSAVIAFSLGPKQ